MRIFIPLLLLPFAFLLFGCSGAPKRALPTVSAVDLNRYMGKWHEVARLPNLFQRSNEKAIAEYSLGEEEVVRVRNSAIRPDGTTRGIEGTAKVVPGSDGARLSVRFSGIAGLVPVSKQGNYWIIALDENYESAMVGTPDRKFLWILARDADISKSVIDGYLEKAKALGFPVEKILRAQ